MTSNSDLRFGVQALLMGLLRNDQLLECASVWLNDLDMAALSAGPARTLRAILLEFGFMDAEGAETVEAALESDAGAPSGVDPQVRRELIDMRPPPDVLEWLRALVDRAAPAARFVPVPRDERYEVRGEIARGGLGCVLEGVDRHLGRDVALKVVLDGMPPEVTERFVREARITSKLDHPNIVPVHDFDEMPDPRGGRRLVLCMKRIRGRDLGTLLGAIKRGEPDAQRWTRSRLLAMFQDICLGIAYAHSKGVLHRDLKPSNVMIGDFGETLVVDWGLAKEAGEATTPVDKSPAAASASSPGEVDLQLTMDGDLVGTPLYMSPEQAAGRHSDIDPRSDVYSLGGILYTILTHRPPFSGGTREQVIKSVLSGRVEAPSVLVARARSVFEGEAPASAPLSLPEQIPPDLEAICMKALAHRREDRHSTAIELHDEIQLFLEGVKARERNLRLAEEAIAKATSAMERQKRLAEESKATLAEAKKLEKEVKPLEEKTALWALQDRAKQLGRAAVDAFSEASAALSSALTHDPTHLEARKLRAEQYWKRYLEAEEAGDEREMQVNRAIVERYNDGPFDTLLKGDGTLTLKTRAYPCRCLLDGRTVRREELAWQGYHPFSGRALDGLKGAEGMLELEPNEPVRLKVHAANCEPTALDGAEVWLFRFEEIGRLLVPVTPSGIRGAGEQPVPAATIDGTFEKTSPYRPQGAGIYLGRTPIENQSLPIGSFLLLLSLEGRAPIRVPVTVSRLGHCAQDVTMFRPGEIPPGFVPISAGPFGYQGDPESGHSEPPDTKIVDDVFIARHPVTCREYCRFLNELAKRCPAEAAKRVPRESQESNFYWPGPPYVVPTAAWLASAPESLKATFTRLSTCPADWQEDWPVLGVSWEDGMAWAAWKRGCTEGLAMLPHEFEWEKSARGTDRRYFSWGCHWDDRWANGLRSNPEGARPVSVEEFTTDESPYGVRGLGGNSVDNCLGVPGPEHGGVRLFRGGSWTYTGGSSRATNRTGDPPRRVAEHIGLRGAFAVRLSIAPAPRLRP